MTIDNLIIDGTNIEHRIFFITQKAENVYMEGQRNHIYNFLSWLLKLVENFRPTEVYMTWDRKLSPEITNFRQELLCGEYKAKRIKHANIQEMYDKEATLLEILESAGIKNIFPNTLESDDVCAWLSKTLQGDNIIVSTDNDLLQLVGPGNSVWDLKRLITHKNFEVLKGVKRDHFVLYKSIIGDTSDNISGVKGYGDKKAKKLLASWGENKLPDDIERIIERNKKLIDLHYGYKHQKGEEQKYIEQLKCMQNIEGNKYKFHELCIKEGLSIISNDINRWGRFINRNFISNFIKSLS